MLCGQVGDNAFDFLYILTGLADPEPTLGVICDEYPNRVNGESASGDTSSKETWKNRKGIVKDVDLGKVKKMAW